MRMTLALILLLLTSSQAFAFPELTRFGYNNCTACHVSPSGGGILTAYGRSLSAEVLSTFGNEKTAGVFWGAVDRDKVEEWLLLGGDLRAVQVHREDSQRKVGKFIKMQADVQAAWVRDKYGAVMTIGEWEDPAWRPYATSFYGFWRPRDEFTLRGGRFMPAYGLHIVDHIAYARSFLGFGLGGTRDSLEAQWTGETVTVNLTHSKQYETNNPEVADSIQGQYFFWERFKVAANYWSGRATAFKRSIAGVWGVLGFTKRFYLNTEADWQEQNNSGSVTRSFVSYNKLGYTLFKGFDLLFLSEHLHSDLKQHGTIINRHGPGVQFYPLTHFEIAGAWTKQKSEALNAREEDYAWLLLHYYF